MNFFRDGILYEENLRGLSSLKSVKRLRDLRELVGSIYIWMRYLSKVRDGQNE
jgi:hypothetical protein